MSKKLIYLTCFVLVLSMAGQASAELILHWMFNEGSGDVAYDSSGNGRDGTISGATWTVGDKGPCLEFGGDGGFVIDDDAGEYMNGLSAMTVAMWIKSDVIGTDSGFIIFEDPQGRDTRNIRYDQDMGGGLLNGIKYGACVNTGDTDDDEDESPPDVQTTEWQHIAVTWASGDGAFPVGLNLYIDGVLQTPSTDEPGAEGVLTDYDRVMVGKGGKDDGDTESWDGLIDDVRIYDHVLSEVEILGAMQGTVWPYAIGPYPADGALYEDTWVNLSWTPGGLAVSHDVYLGDNFDDVNDGAEAAFRGNLGQASLLAGFTGYPYPDGLVPGTTYYWRVDEVNEAEPNSPWKGDIWSFSIPPRTAYNPVPAVGAKFIAPDAELSWTGGFNAKLHTVYFGDNFDDVNNATAEGTQQVATTYTPGTLELEKTYYWRVDESDPPATHKGDVWSFMTAGEGGGVRANYYTGMNFETLVLTRTDPQIDFNWGNPGGPDPTVGDDNFSCRWTGEVEAAFTETYTFYTNSDDGIRLWVDGQQLVDNWTNHGNTENSGKIDLVAGNTYSFVMEHYEDGGGAVAELRWSSPRTPKDLIPQAALSLPVKAGNPSPGNGTVDVSQISTLSWSAGEQAASHNIYFGTDADAVKNADTGSPEYKGGRNLGSESYDPGQLLWDTTYYWRVDELEADGTVQKGNLWSFTTAGFLVVDDMEAYNDINEDEPGSNRIYMAWLDGFVDPMNGSTVGHLDPPFAEQTTVHSGSQSMPFAYDNAVGKSWATLALTYPRNWTENGVDRLVIWYIGNAANAAETMYVVLNGSAGVDNDDANAAQATAWTEWSIDLQAFGINLTNVNTITLGFGNRNNPSAGGAGSVFFDDIRLYKSAP